MNDAEAKKAGWKQRVSREMKSYFLNFIYLTIVFGSFAWYKRLVLAEHGILYLDYGVAVIEALVLAKVIMIGDLLHLGNRLKGRPLIVPTIYRAITFGIWVGLFKIVEQFVGSILRGKGFAGGVDRLIAHNLYEILAMSLVVGFAFVPFFAFKELAQTLGEGKLSELFLRKGN